MEKQSYIQRYAAFGEFSPSFGGSSVRRFFSAIFSSSPNGGLLHPFLGPL